MISRKPFLCCVCGLAILTLVSGCPSTVSTPLPNPSFYPINTYPYVANNQTMQTYITATNQSLQWGMDLTVTFRGTNGAAVSTFKKRLNKGASHRFSPPSGFEGSAILEGQGAQYSLASQVELRALNGQGAALASPAYNPVSSIMVLCPTVADAPAGPLHTQIHAINYHSDFPLYIEFDHLADVGCADVFETPVNPLALYSFYPSQKFQAGAGSGIQDFQLIAYGNTGPNRSGQQDWVFSCALLTTGASGLALDNYADVWSLSWPPFGQGGVYPHLYFPDVQDDGVNRADRLYIKVSCDSDYFIYQNYKFHFCNDNGGKTTITLPLVHNFMHVDSLAILEPMDVLGKPFKGSVWIETEDPMQTQIRRVALGKWVDASTACPVGNYRRCILPYVSSKDANWKYEIVLFYPEDIYPAPDLLSEPPPPIAYGGPADPAPPADERVVLRFYNMGGYYRGWVALYMLKNQTKRLSLAQVAAYLQEPFEGSVQIEPFVAVELESSHVNGQAHASMNPWLTGQF